MNIILALEQLGYTNVEDFEVHVKDDGTVFLRDWHHLDPEPDTATLEQAWADWQVANPTDLTQKRTDAKANIDRAAEQARLRFITWGTGQAMTYSEKSDEAADFVAAGYPADVSSYPFIQAEMNALGETATEVADRILAKKSAWITAGAAIEEIRLKGKNDIDDAMDEAEILSVRDTTISALGAL